MEVVDAEFAAWRGPVGLVSYVSEGLTYQRWHTNRPLESIGLHGREHYEDRGLADGLGDGQLLRCGGQSIDAHPESHPRIYRGSSHYAKT